MKLLFLGVDGTSFRVMKRLKQTNPEFFERVKDSILFSERTGNYPEPHTGPSWLTIYTGLNSNVHGIESGGWLNQHKGYNDLRYKTVWEILDEEGFSVGLFGLPMTYPAPELKNGWSVSGFPRPPKGECSVYPKNLPKYLKKTRIDILSGEQGGELRKIFDSREIIKIEKEKIQNFIKISKEREVEVGALGITAIDRANHIIPQVNSRLKSMIYHKIKRFAPFAYHYSRIIEFSDDLSEINKEILTVYRDIFSLIHELVVDIKPENTLICSDHGFFKYGCEEYPSNHDVFGYLSGKGEVIKFFKKKNKISDITPIVLDLFGIDQKKIGEKVDRKKHEYSRKEKEEIKKKLRSLGYI